MSLEKAREILRIEAEAIFRVKDQLDASFLKALDILQNCKGKVIVTGIGKSGIICRKIAATLSSTGTPATFLHPADAIHGDLGVITQEDVVIAVSYSGETEEVLNLLAVLKRLGNPIIAMTGNLNSDLAKHADVHLSVAVPREACPLNLAPTASTTATLALGDALAMILSLRKGFQAEDFALRHPGGKLGKKLKKVKELMHTGERVPAVPLDATMRGVILEMSQKGFGITAVVDGENRLVGAISDGDLRRLLEKGDTILEKKAKTCMKSHPITIDKDKLAGEALKIMENRKITSLFIVDSERRLEGIIHIHDLWGLGLF